MFLSMPMAANAESPYYASNALYSTYTSNGLSQQDEMLAIQAVYSCRCAISTVKREDRALENARRLLLVERKEKIPEFMIGMTLAAACSESCFNDKAKGDHKFSRNGKPKAIGILQLWPWVEKYGVDRRNLESSATFWLTHIKRQLRKTKRLCKPRTKKRAWKQAWVTAVRAPKRGGRCNETVKHWRRFLKIQKIKRSIASSEIDGC